MYLYLYIHIHRRKRRSWSRNRGVDIRSHLPIARLAACWRFERHLAMPQETGEFLLDVNIPVLQVRLGLRMKPNDSIDNVKDKIKAVVPRNNFVMVLLLEGVVLEDGHTLLDYNIQDDTKLLLLYDPEPPAAPA